MTTCKGCGAEIVWAVTEAGKALPDERAHLTRLQTVYLQGFVDGAEWWIWHSTGFTAFPSEIDEMVKEASERLAKHKADEFRKP